jgi:iron(III)-salmochelin esterase
MALGLGLLAAAGAAQDRSDYVHQRHVLVTGPDGEPQRVLVIVPRRADRAMHPEGARYSLLVALHGAAEAGKGPDRGLLGWSVDYRLPTAFGALARGSLRRADYGGFVRNGHLDAANAELARTPFQPPVVVTPYVPRGLLAAGAEAARARYLAWLAGPLLEGVRAAYPGVARTRAGTGIDGVSMGGRIALEAGFAHPEAFGSVGGIQPAVRGDADALAGRVDPASAQRIRLLSSDADPFLAATRALSGALRTRRIPHELVVTPGPHGYEYNRGPGAIELLRFHSSALIEEPFAPRDTTD